MPSESQAIEQQPAATIEPLRTIPVSIHLAQVKLADGNIRWFPCYFCKDVDVEYIEVVKRFAPSETMDAALRTLAEQPFGFFGI